MNVYRSKFYEFHPNVFFILRKHYSGERIVAFRLHIIGRKDIVLTPLYDDKGIYYDKVVIDDIDLILGSFHKNLTVEILLETFEKELNSDYKGALTEEWEYFVKKLKEMKNVAGDEI